MIILDECGFGYHTVVYLTRVWLQYIPNQDGMVWDSDGLGTYRLDWGD